MYGLEAQMCAGVAVIGNKRSTNGATSLSDQQMMPCQQCITGLTQRTSSHSMHSRDT